jgi:hypothetical protein
MRRFFFVCTKEDGPVCRPSARTLPLPASGSDPDAQHRYGCRDAPRCPRRRQTCARAGLWTVPAHAWADGRFGLTSKSARPLTTRLNKAGQEARHPAASSRSNPEESQHWRGFAGAVPPLSTSLSRMAVESMPSHRDCGQPGRSQARGCGQPEGYLRLSTGRLHCRPSRVVDHPR